MDCDGLIRLLQKQVDYCLQANRRATFKKWVFSEQARCSATKLAEAGFVFTGSKTDPDSVKCFMCNKSLDSWEKDDDPWAEHQKHSPNCSFAKLDKPERALTVSELVDLRHELMMNILESGLNEERSKMNAEIDRYVEQIKATKM